MPTFVARIRDSQGNSKTEKVIAETLKEARTNLREQGFVIQDLKKSQGLSDFNFKKFQLLNNLKSVQVSIKI